MDAAVVFAHSTAIFMAVRRNPLFTALLAVIFAHMMSTASGRKGAALLTRRLKGSSTAVVYRNIITMFAYGPQPDCGGEGPQFVTLDSSQNVYFSDFCTGRILVVNTSRIMTTVAGTGSVGWPRGDGGPATSATLYYPRGVAVDLLGNIYIATFTTVRVVTKSSGIISTFAGTTAVYGSSGDGGPASNAHLDQPMGVAADSSGNLYIADYSACKIRMVSASGIITTFAGDGYKGFSGEGVPARNASLNLPWGVAVDLSGNVYIGDSYNYRVRVVTKATGNITTLAGTGTYGYGYNNNGPATSTAIGNLEGVSVDMSGNVYIADYNYNVISKVTIDTGILSIYAGGAGVRGSAGDGGPATSAVLYAPRGVAVDSSGNVYIADASNSLIRLVSPNVATCSAGTYVSDTSCAACPAGTYNGASVTTLGVAACLPCAPGYYSSNTGAAACTICPVGSDSSTSGSSKCTPTSAMKYENTIMTYAGTGTWGSSGDGGPATSAQLNGPHSITVDSSGNVFIADLYKIRLVTNSTGIITTYVGTGTYGSSGDGGPATSAQLSEVRGVAVDSSGNVYILDCGFQGGRVRFVTRVTNTITTIAGGGGGEWWHDTGPATNIAYFRAPSSLAVDAFDNLYIAVGDIGSNYNRVLVMNRTQHIAAYAGVNIGSFGDGGPATRAYLSQPTGVAFDSTGDAFISEYGNSKIRLVTKRTGIITTFAGTGVVGSDGDGGPGVAARLAHPGGVAVDLSGNVYIADTDSNKVRRVTTSTGIITTFAGTGTADSSGDGGPASRAQLSSPVGVTLDASGNVYIADYGNNKIRVVKRVTVTAHPTAAPVQPKAAPSGAPAQSTAVPSGAPVAHQPSSPTPKKHQRKMGKKLRAGNVKVDVDIDVGVRVKNFLPVP